MKRINLSVPDEVYEEIKEYKKQFYNLKDATASLMLIRQGLKKWKEERTWPYIS